MVLDMISVWWLFALGFVMFLAGRFFKDFTIAILGGMLLFLQGFYLLVNPISDLGSGFMNTIVGSALFVLGAYIWIRGGLEVLREQGF